MERELCRSTHAHTHARTHTHAHVHAHIQVQVHVHVYTNTQTHRHRFLGEVVKLRAKKEDRKYTDTETLWQLSEVAGKKGGQEIL